MSPLLANIYLHELDRYMESKYLSLTERTAAKPEKTGKRKLPLRQICRRFRCALQWHKGRSPSHKRGTWRIPQHHGTDALRGKDQSHPYNRRLRLPRVQGHKKYRDQRQDGPKGTHTRKGHQAISPRKSRENTARQAPQMSQSRHKIIDSTGSSGGWCEYYRLVQVAPMSVQTS